jgi:pimeloyl-ACP methyl ester carboxylesterase
MSSSRKVLISWIQIAVISLSVSFWCGSSSAARIGKFETIEVAFDAPDTSVELVGYLSMPPAYKAGTGKPPLVILLHQFGESSEAWNTFRDEIVQTGYAAFAMDLRGQGLSIFDLKLRKNRNKNTYYVGEQLKYPSDVAFLVEKAVQSHADKFDTTRFAVIGADVGSSAGLIYAQSDPRVKYVGMISPGLEYEGLRVLPVLREIGDLPLLLAYADKDVYSKESVIMFSDLVQRNYDIQEIGSMYHGNRLINTSIPLRIKLLDDLKKYLPR